MSAPDIRPVICLAPGTLAAALPDAQRSWAEANGFDGQRGRLLPLPDGKGGLAGYLFGIGDATDRPKMVAGLAAAALEPGRYRLEGELDDPLLAALGFRLGAYRFETYLRPRGAVELLPPQGIDLAELDRLAAAATLARDLVNTPASDLGPDALEQRVTQFAAELGMQFSATKGDALRDGFPMIHAVGRAAAEPPRLLDLRWGDPAAPNVTLVGKGVTFDTGGLDIKTAAGMVLMKKDMGGAANVLGTAQAIVSAGLKLNLRVLLPVVENAISASSFRPGDVLRARNGMTVEIGNTDAEGRLILADALALADEESPELIVDMATLTGAARSALGPELPPLYATTDALAEGLLAAGSALDDPLWRMPLHAPYAAMLKSRIADINNAGTGGFAGSVTAALFLQRFVRQAASWAHLDIYAWAPEARAGRSAGGTDQGIRAVYGYLKQQYG